MDRGGRGGDDPASGADASRGRALTGALIAGAVTLIAALAFMLVSVHNGARDQLGRDLSSGTAPVGHARANALFTAISGDYRAAWALLIALAATMLIAAVLTRRATIRSSQLTRTRERARAAERLAHNRLHDPLTGLPNRTLFIDRAEHALAAQRRNGDSLAVLFFDVDRFKRINDSLGHRLGDRVLATVAYRVETALRPSDTVSRYGGDEFMVLSPGVDAEQALELAQRIEAAIEEPMRLVDQRTIHVTTSIGVALHGPGEAELGAETLIARADTAMYSAKRSPGARIQLYDAELHQTGGGQLEAELALRAAIANDELTVHYQPIVDLASGRPRGVEALARWNHPERGLMMPDEFIPLAEESGLIGALGEWVLRRGCSDLAGWRSARLIEDEFVLSVNVSPDQLNDPELPRRFEAILDETGVDAANVCVEVTESAVMAAPERAIAALGRLRGLGLALAIDDFGTGNTSLAQVVNLPIGELKLDRSFVSQLAEPRDAAIVETIATLAGSLGFAAVAEGVETLEQADQLSDLGYPLAQGFHFSRPESSEEMMQRLRRPAGRFR